MGWEDNNGGRTDRDQERKEGHIHNGGRTDRTPEEKGKLEDNSRRHVREQEGTEAGVAMTAWSLFWLFLCLALEPLYFSPVPLYLPMFDFLFEKLYTRAGGAGTGEAAPGSPPPSPSPDNESPSP